MGNHDQIPGINQKGDDFSSVFVWFLKFFFAVKSLLLVFLHILSFPFVFLSFPFRFPSFPIVFCHFLAFNLFSIRFPLFPFRFPSFSSFSFIFHCCCFFHWFFLYFQFSFGFPSCSSFIISFFVFPSFIHFLKDWDFGIPQVWTKATKIIHLWVSNVKKISQEFNAKNHGAMYTNYMRAHFAGNHMF